MKSRESTVWRRDVIGWSLYDFANTIYSMNIVSLYLKRYLVEDLKLDDRYFDIPFAISMAIAAVVLPGLGALSDHSTKKKLFVILFTVTCCISVGLMSIVPATLVMATLALFVIAQFSYEAAMPFYNALLYSVAEGKQARYVSGIGVSFGYVGSVLGMALILPFVTGSMFGFDVGIRGSGKVGSFVPTAILFMLFSVPLIFWVHEAKKHLRKKVSIVGAYRDVWDGIRLTRKYPGVLRFLIADYFIEDAVTTVILNIGLYCSVVLSLSEQQITTFLIISTTSAVGGSILIGKVAERWSLKNLMMLDVIGWVLALILFVFTDSMTVIWVLGSVVGILLGGLWTTSRPLLAELVPREELGRFFGLFSLSGRAAAVIGPLVWTTVVYLFQPQRTLGQWAAGALSLSGDAAAKLPYKVGVLSLGCVMLVGLYIFRKVPHTLSVQND
ncbi:MAG: MFS transporter [candidate division Zixibacteria bacterium]|nr:MFS transporter [candidate division Zixibacteria bacterium]